MPRLSPPAMRVGTGRLVSISRRFALLVPCFNNCLFGLRSTYQLSKDSGIINRSWMEFHLPFRDTGRASSQKHIWSLLPRMHAVWQRAGACAVSRVFVDNFNETAGASFIGTTIGRTCGNSATGCGAGRRIHYGQTNNPIRALMDAVC